jgi:hypothetical protein
VSWLYHTSERERRQYQVKGKKEEGRRKKEQLAMNNEEGIPMDTKERGKLITDAVARICGVLNHNERKQAAANFKVSPPPANHRHM